jgi:hypothetical protein
MVAALNAAVPFKATYTTYPTQVSEPGVIPMIFEIPADGEATHLGKSTWYADMWVDPRSEPWTQGGVMTFTAADGDQLFGTYDGFAEPGGPGIKFWGVFEISGGTGRFEGAKATGDYWGECGTGEGILHFDGTLTK